MLINIQQLEPLAELQLQFQLQVEVWALQIYVRALGHNAYIQLD